MKEVVVSSVAFDDQGVELSYMVLPDDVRSEGHVVRARSCSVTYEAPAGLGADAVDLRTSVIALATKLAETLEQLPVFEPEAAEQMRLQATADEADEDIGMGDGR